MTNPTHLPRVVIVGIGPAGPDQVTAEVLAAIERIPVRYLRTLRHPAASVVGEANSFDDVYDASDTFEQVYQTIVEQLVSAATEHGEVLYAVPGSPLVLERSVRHLLADPRVHVFVLAGMSFLDLAYTRLGIDPVEAGLQLIDGHVFETAAAASTGPLLVAHCHNQRVLSDIKLSVDDGPDVVVLQRLGLPDELVTNVTWADLDREIQADHLTSIFIPSLTAPVAASLMTFHETVRRLREDCPWDREQTHQSLAKYVTAEAQEVVEAIGHLGQDGDGDEDLIDELGDVLLQVVLHAAIGQQEGRFTLADVADAVNTKMIRRHPHVFGDAIANTPEEVAAAWDTIKAAEKAERAARLTEPAAAPPSLSS
jgi:tetrapyrrole methylase family protein / MazG family protein